MSGENIKVGNATRTINYGAGDPRVTNLTFTQAQAAMKDALSRVPTLLADEAKGQRVPGPDVKAMHTPRLQLALDEQHLGHFALRPRLSLNGQVTGPDAVADAKKVVPPKAQDLDPVSVADDTKYADLLQTQKNISAAVKAGLKNYY
jgi:hypothetical protein